MASPTDLDGFLRSDEDNLTLRLGSLFNQLGQAGTKETHVSLTLRFRGQGATNWQGLTPENQAIPVKIDPNGIPNLVDRIEGLISERLGPSPFGTIQIKAFPKGASLHPPLHMERTLLPAESGGLGEPNLALCRGLMAEDRATIRLLIGELVKANQNATVLAGNLAQALTASATTRTATGAASELGAFSNVIGLGLLIMFAPQIKLALGLAPDAPLRDVVNVARKAVVSSTEEAPPAPERFRVPPMALPTSSPEGAPRDTSQPGSGVTGSPEGSEPAAPSRPAPPLLTEDPIAFQAWIKGQLTGDPERAREVVQALTRDPEVMALAMGM